MIPSCGCLAGDAYNGWLEIRSTYCRAAEIREFENFLKRVQDRFYNRRQVVSTFDGILHYLDGEICACMHGLACGKFEDQPNIIITHKENC